MTPIAPTRRSLVGVVLGTALATLLPDIALAQQPIGTFRWRQEPYCNVLQLSVVQAGNVFQLDGVDDQCGAPTAAPVSGLAFINPNGTIGLGLTIVTTPGAAPAYLEATLSFTTINGTWRDADGNTGPFTFAPTGSGGQPRPPARVARLGGGNTFTGNQVVNGAIVANVFQGNGAGLTNLPASQLTGQIPSEAWHEIGAPGEPAFGGGWQNGRPPYICSGPDPQPAGCPVYATAGFYKDALGIVHLKGPCSGASCPPFSSGFLPGTGPRGPPSSLHKGPFPTARLEPASSCFTMASCSCLLAEASFRRITSSRSTESRSGPTSETMFPAHRRSFRRWAVRTAVQTPLSSCPSLSFLVFR